MKGSVVPVVGIRPIVDPIFTKICEPNCITKPETLKIIKRLFSFFILL